ncbi:MAG: ribonuclease T2 family protein [Janthinobacterium lividum]
MKLFAASLLALALFCSPDANAQNPGQPDKFDFYLLNLSWAPEFCSIQGTSTECAAPHGFIVHGLWPQNNDGSYPVDCAPDRPGPTNPQQNLDITPDLKLLAHEWTKHGTCTLLAPDDFFSLEHRAFKGLQIPKLFTALDHEVLLKPAEITALFQQANPQYPAGSILVSCGHNRLTAIEACLSKDGLHPIACQGLHECHAQVVRITPELPPAH